MRLPTLTESTAAICIEKQLDISNSTYSRKALFETAFAVIYSLENENKCTCVQHLLRSGDLESDLDFTIFVIHLFNIEIYRAGNVKNFFEKFLLDHPVGFHVAEDPVVETIDEFERRLEMLESARLIFIGLASEYLEELSGEAVTVFDLKYENSNNLATKVVIGIAADGINELADTRPCRFIKITPVSSKGTQKTF